MTRTWMTQTMRRLLWADVEDQKGEASIWLKDFDRAHRAICAVWRAHGQYNPSRDQLKRVFWTTARMKTDTACTIQELFIKGTKLLKASHREACLAAPALQRNIDNPHDHPTGAMRPKRSIRSPTVSENGSKGQVALSSFASCSLTGSVCIITAQDSCCHQCTIHQRKANRKKWHRILKRWVVPTQMLLSTILTLSGRGRRSTPPTFANGSVRAEAQERSKLRKLRDTNQIDHSTSRSQPLDATQATTPAIKDIHGLQRLDDLMSEDRATFLPKDEVLKKLHGETISNIYAVVDKIMKITHSAGGRHPQFLLTVHCPQSFPLVEHIFGAGMTSAEELLKRIVTIQFQSIQSPIDIGTALRALIEAAFYEWVLQSGQLASSTLVAFVEATHKMD
ncbi:MAG: hypothetical protein Q9204_006801 [Flavoplaca sp. TL-2023a]